MIEINNLSVAYDKRTVLRDVNLSLTTAQSYAIVGPNGAGKSTLIKAMLDLTEKANGTVLFDQKSINEQRERIAYVPQRAEVDWTFPATVADVVMTGRYPHKRFWQRLDAQDRQIVQAALAEVGIADLQNRHIADLSGGQQQRVFIARALAQQADYFFLDEPFVGVDAVTEANIIQTLRQLTASGKTVLVVHHDLSTVKKYFDNVVLLNEKIIAYGNVNEVFTNENVAVTFGIAVIG
jgi:ABC-type Mn2+/Zn2+ transport system ATPase subunit